MPDHNKCCHKIINCDNNRRQPADRISTYRIHITVKTVQHISVTVPVNLKPVCIDDFIKNICLNIIINIDTELRGNPADYIRKSQAENGTSHSQHNHDPQLVGLVSGNDIDHILTCHTAHKPHRGAENAEQRIEHDRSLVFFTVRENPFPVVNNLGKGPVFPSSYQNVQRLKRDSLISLILFHYSL